MKPPPHDRQCDSPPLPAVLRLQAATPLLLPTPSTAHVDTSLIYEPAEDSYLLLDTLSSASETAFLAARFSSPRLPPTQAPSPAPPTPLILEIGPGSGILLSFLTAHARPLFGRPDILTFGIDVNPYACVATGETVRRACAASPSTRDNGTFLGTLRGDISSPLRDGAVDILVFNPPYVPTSSIPPVPPCATPSTSTGSKPSSASTASEREQEQEQERERLLALSWAGGHHGMQVTNRLLAQLPRLLSNHRGVAYILLCQRNAPDQVAQRIRAWGPMWAVDVVGRSGKTAGWEKLVVLRIWRP